MIWAWSGRVIHYEIVGLQIDMIGASNHVTGTAEPKVVKFCTQVGYINSSNRITYHQQKGPGLWSRDCFKILPFVVMQRVALVCQR